MCHWRGRSVELVCSVTKKACRTFTSKIVAIAIFNVIHIIITNFFPIVFVVLLVSKSRSYRRTPRGRGFHNQCECANKSRDSIPATSLSLRRSWTFKSCGFLEFLISLMGKRTLHAWGIFDLTRLELFSSEGLIPGPLLSPSMEDWMAKVCLWTIKLDSLAFTNWDQLVHGDD